MKRKYFVLSFLFFIIPVAALILYLVKEYHSWIYSDSSTTMVLASILLKDKEILSTDWWYSTEFRVLNIEQINAIGYALTGSYLGARVFATICSFGVLALSCCYLCRQLPELKNRMFVLCGLMFMPYSSAWLDTLFLSQYYIVNTSIIYFSLGSILRMRRSCGRGLKILLILLLSMASFLTSLQSVRMTVTLYVPLFITCFLVYLKQKDKSILLTSSIYLTASVFGYIGNRILEMSDKYATSIDPGAVKLSPNFPVTFILKFFSIWGFSVLSPCGCVISVCLIAASIYGAICIFRKKDRDECILLYFTVLVLTEFTVIYAFTDMGVAGRYNIPIAVCFFPVALLGKMPEKHGAVKRVAIAASVILLLIHSTVVLTNPAFVYPGADNRQKNEELLAFLNILKEKNIHEGYTEIEESNVFTELSDGYLEIWVIENNEGGMILYPCLQRRSHADRLPSAPNFIVYTLDDFENSPFKEAALSGQLESYVSPHFCMIILDDM